MGFLSNKIWVRIFLGHPVHMQVFEHIPFVVNCTFNDMLNERLEQRVFD